MSTWTWPTDRIEQFPNFVEILTDDNGFPHAWYGTCNATWRWEPKIHRATGRTIGREAVYGHRPCGAPDAALTGLFLDTDDDWASDPFHPEYRCPEHAPDE